MDAYACQWNKGYQSTCYNTVMDKSNIKIILMHGNGGATIDEKWFPSVKKELEKLGLTVIAKNFPDSIKARATIQLPFLEKELHADETTIIVGHSSGAVAAMRYAENHKLFGSILIGACWTDLEDANERISGYYDHTWHWEKIKKNQNWIVQFASTDDPYIPISEARYIHEQLGTEYYEYTDQRHFSRDILGNPKTAFPEVVEVVKEKLRRANLLL